MPSPEPCPAVRWVTLEPRPQSRNEDLPPGAPTALTPPSDCNLGRKLWWMPAAMNLATGGLLTPVDAQAPCTL